MASRRHLAPARARPSRHCRQGAAGAAGSAAPGVRSPYPRAPRDAVVAAPFPEHPDGPRRIQARQRPRRARDLDGRVLDAVHAEPRLPARAEDGGAGRRHVRLERARRAADRRVLGPVLRQRRPLPPRDRRRRLRATLRARLHRPLHARAPEAVRARDARRGADAGRLEPHLLRQLGLRGGRHRDEGGARLLAREGPGRAHDVRLARACLSRRQLRRHLARGPRQQPAQVRARAPRHRPHAAHAPAREPPRARPGRPRGRARRGPRALRQPVRRREYRRLLRRADRGLDRLPRAAARLPRAPARDLRPARHPARVRRGDHRLRPHRRRVRRAELRRGARPDDDGEGPHQRRAADGRRGGVAAHPRRDRRRRRRRRNRVLPRLHLLGPPGGVRSRPRHARHLSRRRPVRARQGAVAVLPRGRCSRCATSRSSPTCAATA